MIELTTKYNKHLATKVWVNLTHVIYMYRIVKDEATHLVTIKETLWVSETPEQILSL